MKIVKKIIFITISIFLLILLTYNIYKFICINILKKDITTINGYAILEVASGSMEPTLHVGDMIIIDTKIKDYFKDDIITFYDYDGSFITHRIISIDKNEMITKGDNNNTEDEKRSVNKIIGKYVYKIPKGQKIISIFKNPLIASLILLNGILFCIFISIDKKGNLILDDEEKEYKEFREYLDKKDSR